MTQVIPTTAGGTQTSTRKGLSRILDRFIAPAASIHRDEDRRQARLLALFLLILSLLTVLGTALPPLFGMQDPLADPFTLLMGGSALIFLVAYGLSRSRRYRVGAVLTAGVLSVLPFALSLSRHDFDPVRLPSVFAWVTPAYAVWEYFL